MSDEKCDGLATFRRFWPGEEPDLVCVEHAAQSRGVAGHMGFYLHVEPYDGPVVKWGSRWPTCCCSPMPKEKPRRCHVERS